MPFPVGLPAGASGSVELYRPLVRDAVYSFTAGEQTELIIQAANYSHYYGGLYYPPAVGSPGAIASLASSRMAVYGLLCFFAAAVAVSNLALWACGRARRDRVTLLFGLLCATFSLRVCYPFLRMAGAPLVRALYALEDAASGAVVLCAVCLTALLSGLSESVLYRRAVLPACAFFAAASVVFPLFILLYAPALINGYGLAISIWKGLAALWMLGAALCGLARAHKFSRFLLAGAALFGESLLVSVAAINRFEPARGAWPEEYGGFALVLCFAALMVRRGREMAEENLRLSEHLREEVEKKTASLTAVLTERKQFLAQLVHDFKAPMASMRGYADLIRAQDVGVDPETRGYLDAIRDRMDALDERFQDLREFTAGDQQPDARAALCLNDLLSEFHRRNLPDMELGGQGFLLQLPGERLDVFGSRGQLWRALENLCYNALSFTPEDGRLTLSLARDGDAAVVTVADTGIGISPEDLPHLFERGYSRRADGSGSGLGLFITRSIVLEHGGEISAASGPGGAAFTIRLPLSRTKRL